MKRLLILVLFLLNFSNSFSNQDLIFVAIDGDDIGSKVEMAALKNDPKETYKISKQIRDSFKALKKKQFVKKLSNNQTEFILFGGDSLAFSLDKNLSDKVDEIRKSFNNFSNFTITLGVGDSILKASQALLYGKHTGKNRTIFWNPEIFDVLNSIKKKTTDEKIGWILNQC